MRILSILLAVLFMIGALHESPPTCAADHTPGRVRVVAHVHVDGHDHETTTDPHHEEHGHAHPVIDLSRPETMIARIVLPQPLYAAAHPALTPWQSRVPVDPPLNTRAA